MPNSKVKSRETRPKLRRRTKRRLTWAGAALAGLIVFLIFYLWAGARPGQWVASLGNEHLQAADQKHVPYNSDPPTSGPHLPYIAAWAIHSEPIAKELQVHNLEEGGVLVQYNCPQACPDLVARLRRDLARAKGHGLDPEKVYRAALEVQPTMAPNPLLPDSLPTFEEVAPS